MNTDNRPSRPTGARSPGVPSRRAIGALVAGALAIGVLAGASLAPAPPSSLASSSTILTRLLVLLAARAEGGGLHASAAPASPPERASAVTATLGDSRSKSASSARRREASAAGSSSSQASPSEGSSSPGGPDKGKAEKKPVRLPPISHVWLVVLSGSDFAAASAAPASYPYLTGQLLEQGTLLERYSAIEGYELAGDAALLTGGVGESVSTISEPGCGVPAAPGAASTSPGVPSGGACPSAVAGGQVEADSFLQRVLAPILTSSAYSERGLIVVTFGAAAQEAGLAATTLAAQPAVGALLLSPVLKATGRRSEAFNSLAPRESLEAIFGHS